MDASEEVSLLAECGLTTAVRPRNEDYKPLPKGAHPDLRSSRSNRPSLWVELPLSW